MLRSSDDNEGVLQQQQQQQQQQRHTQHIARRYPFTSLSPPPSPPLPHSSCIHLHVRCFSRLTQSTYLNLPIIPPPSVPPFTYVSLAHLLKGYPAAPANCATGPFTLQSSYYRRWIANHHRHHHRQQQQQQHHHHMIFQQQMMLCLSQQQQLQQQQLSGL